MGSPDKILSIIPTRGGSEGIKGKNIFPFEGKPLLAHTILAALECSDLTTVLVTTDDNDIAAVAREYGAEIFRHPTELSAQGKPTAPVIQYVVRELTESGRDYDLVAVLRATSPLRTADDISKAYKLMKDKAAHSVVSLTQDNTMNPIRLKIIDEIGFVRDIVEAEDGQPIRRQELADTYRRNGAIYIAYLSVVLEGRLWDKDCMGYVMPQERSVNINTAWDLIHAAAYYRALKGDEFGEYLKNGSK